MPGISLNVDLEEIRGKLSADEEANFDWLHLYNYDNRDIQRQKVRLVLHSQERFGEDYLK